LCSWCKWSHDFSISPVSVNDNWFFVMSVFIDIRWCFMYHLGRDVQDGVYRKKKARLLLLAWVDKSCIS
jgi:hypothetical protein